MDSMKELKDWLVTKCRLPGFQQSLKPPDGSESKFAANIVTPQSIPEFVIPGSGESSRNPSICSSDDLRSHSSGMSATCSPCTSPAVSPRHSLAGLAVPENKSPVKVRSAPASPRRDSHGFLRDFGAKSMTNLQPVSAARGESGGRDSCTGLEGSTPRSRSSLGFSAFPQSRRKSSFHPRSSEAEQKYNKGFMRRPFRSQESLFCQDASGAAAAAATPEIHCLSAMPAATSTRRCSPVFADQNDYLPLRESFRRSQRYYRRRSSLAQVEMTTALWRQSSELCSAQAGSDSPSRRIPVTSTLMTPLLHPAHAHKRHSAPSTACSISISLHTSDGEGEGEELEACSSGDVAAASTTTATSSSSSSREEHQGNGGGERGKTVTERGDIKFSFQYFPATRRLKLLLIRAENLHFPERPDIVTNPFFKVGL